MLRVVVGIVFDISVEDELGVFQRSVVDQPVQFEALVHIMGNFIFYGVGVYGDLGTVGKAEFYAGSVHIVVAVDGG